MKRQFKTVATAHALDPVQSADVGTHSLLIIPENHLAYTSLSQRQDSPITYIYGPSGVGKSHLLTHHLRERLSKQSDLIFRRITASEFHSLFIEAAESNAIAEFQDDFRSAELVVCEDLQFLDGKSQTQLQLLNLVDFLTSHGSAVIVTASMLPGAYRRGLLPKLRNRLQGSNVAKIKQPNSESRTALLQHFAQSRQIAIATDVIQFIGESYAVSPRELLGILLQVDAASRIQQSTIGETFVRQLLRHESNTSKMTIARVTRAVARIFGVPVQQIRSSSRTQDVLLARQSAMFLARRICQTKLSEIAEYFGRKNHSSVIHAYKRVETLRKQNAAIRQSLKQIEDALQSV